MRLIFLSLLLLCACSSSYKFPSPYRGALPTATSPGNYSTVTSLSFNTDEQAFTVQPFDGYPDSKVVGYIWKEDTVIEAFFKKEMGTRPFLYGTGTYLYPGTVWVSQNKLIDEVEVTNFNWAEFLFYVKRDSSENVHKRLLPDSRQLPRTDYFTNPFFRFYPVVGITHEQAEIYCRWRTYVVNENNKNILAEKGNEQPKKFRLEYRLPTEQEWETYAACGIDVKKYAYGVKYPEAKININPKAAAYLKIKNELSQSVTQIQNDIEAFNKREEKLEAYTVSRKNAPYFLANKTPFYVFDLPINNYGLYNMIGNVAEMVKEKGIVKGGSYLEPLENCAITGKGNYSGASPTIGFRAVCEIIFEE